MLFITKKNHLRLMPHGKEHLLQGPILEDTSIIEVQRLGENAYLHIIL